MLPPLRRLFGALGDAWKGVSVLGIVVAAGFGAGLALGGYAQIPRRLFLLEAHQTVTDSVARDLAQQMHGVRALIRTQLCLTISEKKKGDWQECLIGDYKP